MATITPIIQQNNSRKDGRWLVVFRLTHKRKSVYIKTSHLITESQLNKDRTIKQKFVITYLSEDINDLQRKISRLGLRAETYTASQLKDILTADGKEIDFMLFLDECFAELQKTKRPNTVSTYRSTINHIKDYQGGRPLMSNEITSKYIKAFMEYVKTPHKIVRFTGPEKTNRTEKTSNVVSGNSLYTVYFRFKKIFDMFKEKYNDDDLGIIRVPHNPFAKVPVPKMEATAKRSLKIEDIRKIRDYQPVNRSEMIGKNMFMIIFMMCGINAVDLKNNLYQSEGRLNYNRSKVEGRRKDRGFISVAIPKEAKPYVDWYLSIKDNWSNSKNLILAINKGLKSIAKNIGIDEGISTYYARHSFATIARNDCKKHKEDVSIALNHTDRDTSTTDIYIAPDWSIIDEVQNAVISKLNEDLKIS
ncbi:tyrosine-type recombinase/integrase [Sphingobacterium multivorum]|uniref:Putative Phage integrase SAM-like domain-containing protein n=1 Tax=Sphingobacterium multivorum TaxID=28454 RepID=A0A654CZS8_SPHMU|nr:phage integrase SAM-like domain-containing protein [Sphingobacterium multivorum]VXC99082.1 putative Phage integrase SAM-like domain-containing protein [Sphingobacterium multivorum]